MTKLLPDEPDMFLEIISDDFESVQESKEEKIKNHITPIKTCVDLLLTDNMGEVSYHQKKNFELIKSELEKVTDLLQTSQNKIIVNSTKYESIPQEEKTEFLENVPHSSLKIANNHKRVTEKNYQTLALTILTSLIVLAGMSLVTADGLFEELNELVTPTSKYIIENLKGVTIDTWLSWRVTDGDVLYVNIVNAEEYPEKAELVKNAILSNENIKVDNKLINSELDGTSTYYLGWVGALEKASQFPTELYIPKNIEVITATNGAGEIIIRLEDKSHSDGISGLTESISDEYQHQLLKSTITIYDVEDISDNQLQAVARHELGHAFGLSHSSDPDDLMHPTLKTGFPYISRCDVNAISKLYDGSKQSKVLCVK